MKGKREARPAWGGTFTGHLEFGAPPPPVLEPPFRPYHPLSLLSFTAPSPHSVVDLAPVSPHPEAPSRPPSRGKLV